VIIDDADHPAVEGGTYVIAYGELVDGYRHAYRDGRRVRYSRSRAHPADPRCPECAEEAPRG
jgi:hypothetical protein